MKKETVPVEVAQESRQETEPAEVADAPPPPSSSAEQATHDDVDADVDEDQLLKELFGDTGGSSEESPGGGEPDTGEMTALGEKPAQEENLDNFFDQIIQKEISSDTMPSAKPEKAETASNVDKDDDLNQFLDNLLSSEEDADTSPSNQPEEKSVAPLQAAESIIEKAADQAEMSVAIEPASGEENDIDDLLADLKKDEDAPPVEKKATSADKKKTKSDKTMAEDTLNEIMAEADDESSSEAKTTPESGQEAGAEKESEDALWSQAFAEQDGLNQELKTEKPLTAEGGEDALWAQAFAEQDGLNQELKTEKPLTAEGGEDALWAQAFAEQDGLNQELKTEKPLTAEGGEDALWGQAFAEQEELNKKTEGTKQKAESAVATEEEEEKTGDDETEEEKEEEEAEEDEEESEDEEEKPQRKKLGPIPLPTSTVGKLLVGAGLVAVALTGAGVYFGVKTFVPPELMKKIPFLKKFVHEEALAPAQPPEVEVAGKPSGETPSEETPSEETPDEAAKPGEVPKPAEAPKPGEAAKPGEAPKPAEAPKSGEAAKPGEAPKPVEAPKPGEAAKPGEAPKEDISKALESALGTQKAASPEEGVESVAPKDTNITLSAIMPVAFNINDIRILTFSLEIELDNEATTKLIREALPVYEKVMISTVEKFLSNKFFNDILYVREKLSKELQTSFNKNIQGGKVKKTKFKDFLVQ